MALEILVKKDGDNFVRTQAAEELSEQFHEIMIDEYQDSNLVQELLLGSVAKENNRFMVGDIKQSIYRFRNARPDLFLEKMNTFETTDGAKNRLVFLTKNFRSRDVVLEATNDVFTDIMQEDFGGIAYDKEAMLYLGADFPETAKRHADNVTIFGISDKSDQGNRSAGDRENDMRVRGSGRSDVCAWRGRRVPAGAVWRYGGIDAFDEK